MAWAAVPASVPRAGDPWFAAPASALADADGDGDDDGGDDDGGDGARSATARSGHWRSRNFRRCYPCSLDPLRNKIIIRHRKSVLTALLKRENRFILETLWMLDNRVERAETLVELFLRWAKGNPTTSR